jgi:hypothetical protein
MKVTTIARAKGAVNMDFVMYVESLNENYHTITAIILPDGTMIKRAGELMDFAPLKKYVGNLFIFVRNGVVDPSVKVLKSVEVDENGVGIFSYDEINKRLIS